MDPSADGARTGVRKNGFSKPTLFLRHSVLTKRPAARRRRIGLTSYLSSARREGARRHLLSPAGNKGFATSGETASSLTAKEMVQVTSALLAIAAAAAGLAGVATETPAPTVARTLAYFKPDC